MKSNFRFFLLFPVIFFWACTSKVERPADYPILPLPFTQVKLTDHFWAPRIKTNTDVTIPIAFKHCETTGRIKNFEIAGGMAQGSFCTLYPFDDSDVFKIIEGASYALHDHYDPELDAYLDSLIFKIAAAQEDDGYLYTNRTINPDSTHPWAGTTRWILDHELSHELYNAGHLYEAAVAHYQATGKRTLLDVALKNADLVYKDLGWDKVEEYPGHQEIEIGLVKLYRITGDTRYLDLAKFFLDVRGPNGEQYNQAHQKVVQQTEAVGHAVRACYMYSAMADVAALTGDQAYVDAISRIWENVVTKKYYITGGIGQTGDNEGFGPDYDLPNLEAYCETCASIAMVFWNHRLFLMKGDPRYIDVMERTMYNALLSGVSLSGDLFFYPNPLESDGRHQRKAWFGCACCPSNICRFLPSVPGYIYASRAREVYVNLFISSEAEIGLGTDTIVIRQESNYPWDGRIAFTIDPEKSCKFKLFLRIPGWTLNEPVPGDLYGYNRPANPQVKVSVNGSAINPVTDGGYVSIERKWDNGDQVELVLPMQVRVIRANEKVEADRGHIALQRGPMVYCVEDKDQDPPNLLNLRIPEESSFNTRFEERFFTGLQIIQFNGIDDKSAGMRQITAIPYCYWANRGPGEMMVWLPKQALQ